MAGFFVRQQNYVAKIAREYFGPVSTPEIDEVDELWNLHVDPDKIAADQHYYQLVLEQYKLYAEMADRVSARRGLTNTFFLTFNTTTFAAVAFFWGEGPRLPDASLVLPLLALLIQCLAWYWILRSYRQLNAGKYVVIGALEQRLPASPYWRAEWSALGRGNSPSRYLPMTQVEQLIPLLFAATYMLGYLIVLLS